MSKKQKCEWYIEGRAKWCSRNAYWAVDMRRADGLRLRSTHLCTQHCLAVQDGAAGAELTVISVRGVPAGFDTVDA